MPNVIFRNGEFSTNNEGLIESLINDPMNKDNKMSTIKVTPLHDRVIVKRDEAVDKTEGGIIIPDTAKEKPYKGDVIAVGNGKKDEPMVVKVGDKVLYAKHAGSEIEIDGTKYLVMREADILAVI